MEYIGDNFLTQVIEKLTRKSSVGTGVYNQ